MNTFELSKKDLMLHTRCGFVSSSVKPSGLTDNKNWILVIAGMITVFVYLISMLE